jgi:hypothetical protein
MTKPDPGSSRINEDSTAVVVGGADFGLGQLYRQTSKREQAQEHLTIATTMYREMDMQFWLEQAEVEIKESTK